MDALGHSRRRIGRRLRAGVRGDGRRAAALARRWTSRAIVAALITTEAGVEIAAASSHDAAAGRGSAVVAYPGPRWGFAHPRTTITLSGADPASLGVVRVEGSVSGPHPGTVHALSGRRGTVFTPDLPFQPGERVTVRSAADVRGASGGAFTFTVAELATVARLPPDLRVAGPLGRTGTGGCVPRRPRFRTLPALRPAGWCLSHRPRPGVAAGHILVTPRSHPERRRSDQHGAMILSSRGELLWYSPRPSVARDLKTVTYEGEPMLALHQSTGERPAHYELLDRRYRTVTRITARNGYRTNLHELQLTRGGTAYVSAYQAVLHPALRRPVTDYVIQEIDVRSRDVLFEWHALDHVPPSASYQTRPPTRYAWDYFHGNSIEPPNGSGTIIVSARNTSAVYGIDRATGELRWTLGGKRDDFGLVRRHAGRQFCAQHDARRAPGGDITIFDDGGLVLGNERDCPVHRARVQRFRLHLRGRRARLIRTIASDRSSERGRGLYAWASGGARRQANGNMLVNWGTTGRITEVTPRGDVVNGLQLESYSYRAVRSAWIGRPGGRPAIAASRDAAGTRVRASWNGATEVARWRVLGGRSEHRLRRKRASRRFAGLETVIRARTRSRYVAVEALDSDGSVLGRSPAVRVR